MQPLYMHRNINTLPDEVLLLVMEQMGPLELYNFMLTCKKHYYLILPNISHFMKLFTKSCTLKIEKFLWNQIYNPLINYIPPEELFMKMIGVYLFANTTILERIWENYYMETHHEYGPLPEFNVLYTIKFQAGMFYTFTKSVGLSTEKNLHISSMLSYSSGDYMFKNLFQFMIKYPDLSSNLIETIELDFKDFTELEITFEMLDTCIQNAIQIGGTDRNAYYSVHGERYDDYIGLLQQGFSSDDAFDELHIF